MSLALVAGLAGAAALGLALYLNRGKSWSWKDKVVVITGASSGIGKSLALNLAAQGSKLVLAARGKDLLEVTAECNKFSTDCAISVFTDVTKEADCKKLIDEAIAKYGQIDGLILNAGISMNHPFDQLESLEPVRKVMDVNFWGTVQVLQYALPFLEKRTESRIMVVSSVSGVLGIPGRTGYCASKFALHGFFDALRFEVARYGVSVTIVCPGFVRTNIANSRTAGGTGNDENIKNGMDPDYCASISLNACAKGVRTFMTHAIHKPAPFLKALLPEAVLDRIVLKGANNAAQLEGKKKD